MKKRAVIFSGQGAQVVGMGADLYESSAAARELYDRADQALGFPLTEFSFRGPVEKLTDTSVCQPALYVHGLALLAELRRAIPGFEFAASAGLSLGEYTAHAAAGSFDFATGLYLVHERGKLMQQACEATQGAMISLIGATSAQAELIAANAGVDVANYNCPGQIVLSGAAGKIAIVPEAAAQQGVKRAIPLKVAGAYHSQLMKLAQDGLAPHLAAATIHAPKVVVLANVTGQPVRDPAEIRATLGRQVCGSVRWEECVRDLMAQGVTQLIELGPGAVLAGLARRIDKDLECVSIGTLSELEEKKHALIQ